MNSISRTRLVAAFLVSAALVYGQQKASAPAPTPAPVSVRTVSPKPATGAANYTIPGRTEPLESARIFTRATGVIKERTYDIGDIVREGDVLAEVSTPDLDRAADAAQAGLEQAEVRAANARTLAKRTTGLLEANAISQEEADHRTSDAAAADAGVRVAQADLAKIKEQQGFAKVRAPFNAVVAARNFDRGDRVRGDSATSEGWLFYLVRIDQLRFAVNATPDLALRLKLGLKANLRFNEFPGRTFVATVSRSSRVFDPTAGTMRVELILDNPELAIPAGLTGNASFELQPEQGTFLIPNNALVLRAGNASVATVQNGRMVSVGVNPGRNFGETLEVTSGNLSLGSQVILNPNAMLRPGDAVTVASPN